MKRRPRRAALLVSSALMATALWSGAGSIGAPAAAVPSLSLTEVLALAKVKAPPLGTGLKIHADFPEGRPFEVDGVKVTSLSVDITPTGDVLITNMIRRPAGGGSTSDDGTHDCADNEFAPEGVRWEKSALPLKWHFDSNSVAYPSPIEAKLIEAHNAWQNTRSRCTTEDSIDFSFQYAGRTWRGVARDGFNSVGFGPLGGYAIAMNYLWYQGVTALETDLRLKKGRIWTNRTHIKDKYQIVNVATHELGHQIGLDDLGHAHSRLTMYGVVSKGELSKVSLGRGDVRGATFLSPKV